MQEVAGVEDGHRPAAAALRRRRRSHERLAEIEHALVVLAQSRAAARRRRHEDGAGGHAREQLLAHALARGQLAVVQVKRAAAALLGAGDDVVAGRRE